MSFLDKVRSGGGGSVEGTVTDVFFVNGWPLGEGGVWIDDEDDRANTDSTNLVVQVKPEGAEEPVSKVMYLGSNAYLVLEDDGHELRAGEDGDVNEDRAPQLYVEGDAYRFIASLADTTFPMEAFDAALEENKIDFRPLIGYRLRIVNETDEEANKKFGKRKAKKGKNKGKEFNRTWTKCAAVLSGPVDKKAAKGTTKTTGKSTKATNTKVIEDDADDDAGVDTTVADKFLKRVLKGEGGKVFRAKFSLAITRLMQKEKMNLDENKALLKQVKSDEYLTDAAERGLVKLGGTAKDPTVSLPE